MNLYVLALAALSIQGPAGNASASAASRPPLLRVADVQMSLADLAKSVKCNVAHYRFYTFKKRTDVPTTVTMTTSADGWCWTAPRRKDGSGFSGGVQTPPSHGQVAVVADPAGPTRFAYRPDAGFVGQDHFVVVLHPNENILDFTVDVQPAR